MSLNNDDGHINEIKSFVEMITAEKAQLIEKNALLTLKLKDSQEKNNVLMLENSALTARISELEKNTKLEQPSEQETISRLKFDNSLLQRKIMELLSKMEAAEPTNPPVQTFVQTFENFKIPEPIKPKISEKDIFNSFKNWLLSTEMKMAPARCIMRIERYSEIPFDYILCITHEFSSKTYFIPISELTAFALEKNRPVSQICESYLPESVTKGIPLVNNNPIAIRIGSCAMQCHMTADTVTIIDQKMEVVSIDTKFLDAATTAYFRMTYKSS